MNYEKSKKTLCKRSLEDLYISLHNFNKYYIHYPGGRTHNNLRIGIVLEELGKRSYLKDKRGENEKK